MNRLLLVIAVIFAFDSIGAATASYAHGGQASHRVFGAIAADAGEQCVTAAASTVDAYKPCAKKLGGIAIPCPHQPALLPVAMDVEQPYPEAKNEPRILTLTLGRYGPERQFRPPRG